MKPPLLFTVDELRRFPSESRIRFLECSGNASYKRPYGKTASDPMGPDGAGELHLNTVQPEVSKARSARTSTASVRDVLSLVDCRVFGSS